MSTRPQIAETDPEPRPTTTQIATRHAPRTFSPTNVNPCPEMFSGKWRDARE